MACSGRYAHEYQAIGFLLKYSNGWKRPVDRYWASHLLGGEAVFWSRLWLFT